MNIAEKGNIFIFSYIQKIIITEFGNKTSTVRWQVCTCE